MSKINYDCFCKKDAERPCLVEAKLTYEQAPNCISDEDDYERLSVELANGGVEADNAFFVISTDKWSINDENDLSDIIQDFKERILNIKKES